MFSSVLVGKLLFVLHLAVLGLAQQHLCHQKSLRIQKVLCRSDSRLLFILAESLANNVVFTCFSPAGMKPKIKLLIFFGVGSEEYR